DENFSTAVNISTAPTGFLIPPSTALITYGMASGGTSIAALFIGGVIPGILWGLSCMIVAYFYAKRQGYVDENKITFKQFIHVLLEALPSLLLVIIVIGGIVGGAFTATEGAGIAVVYTMVLSMIFYKSLSIKG